MPAPIHVPLGRATVVARWMSEALARSGRAHLDTNVSSAVRVCRAAAAEGLPLAGGFFRLGGEPFTPARQRIFIEAGCRALSHYSISEAGHMAIGCGDPGTHDDMHLLTDKMAVVQAGAAPGLPERPGIEPFFLTTLLPSSPKLMLNVESGDYGVMEGRACGCPLGEAGFRTHIRGVRSYEKLTGEGMHFVGSHLLDLVENVLPDRFGGDPTDYQFAESEERGLPVVALRIHPRLGAIDEEAAVTAVLAALGSGTPGGVMMAGQWRQGRTLRVERTPPLATFASKILALDSPRPSGHE